MKRIYLTVEDHLNEINTFEKGCWVHLQNPTREEIDGMAESLRRLSRVMPKADGDKSR